MRESLYDRCLTLQTLWDLWLNGIRTNQCNHAGVWGKRGRRDTVCLPAHRSFWQGSSTRSAFACMEWQTANWPHEYYFALRSPQMPHKEPGQQCPTNLTIVNVMNASACLLRRVQNSQVYVFSVKPLKSPLSFSVRSNMSCRAYLKIYFLSMTQLKTPSSSFSLSSSAHFAQLLLPFLAALSLHLSALPAHEWFLKWSICPRMPIYQPVSAFIDRVGIRSHTVQWVKVLFMHVHSTPGLNHSSNSGCRLKHTVTCMLYYIPANWIYCQ